jgi:diguanylate cyclase (GGDEF)-like protein/putative nucleotidyltransferase with HDIG domain
MSFVLDILFISILVRYSGGLESPFILAYAILLVRIGIKKEDFWEVIIIGLIGHSIYVIILYSYYNSLDFYFTLKFWIQCLLLGGTFANVILVTRVLSNRTSRLKKANKKLRKRSITDLVTGLYNFRYFHECLKKEIKRAKEGKIELALIKIDMDDFKDYNRYVGTKKGDKALYQVGQLLREVVPDNYVITRLGSDEFSVIMADTSKISGEELSKKIRDEIHRYPFEGEDNLVNGVLTASLGLAFYTEGIESGQELINKADEALYRVKLSHKDGVRFYSSMFEDLKNEFGDGDPALINTLRTLLTVINARDCYTYGHSERVVKYSLAIGREMNLTGEKLRLLRYAAFLHDIGKIEIGRDVLNKKGRLDNDEWDLIRKHTIFGVNIVEPLQNLEDIIPPIMYHHERYDGGGYPSGLQGEEIPLLARILTVADSCDAMTTNRPYRAAMSCEEAVKELKDERGSQFDPELVDVFIKVVDEVYEGMNFQVS